MSVLDLASVFELFLDEIRREDSADLIALDAGSEPAMFFRGIPAGHLFGFF
jgi:hypothetical protein